MSKNSNAYTQLRLERRIVALKQSVEAYDHMLGMPNLSALMRRDTEIWRNQAHSLLESYQVLWAHVPTEHIAPILDTIERLEKTLEDLQEDLNSRD